MKRREFITLLGDVAIEYRWARGQYDRLSAVDLFDKAGLGQPLLEPRHVDFPCFGRGDVEKADHWHLLLRACRQRAYRRAGLGRGLGRIAGWR